MRVLFIGESRLSPRGKRTYFGTEVEWTPIKIDGEWQAVTGEIDEYTCESICRNTDAYVEYKDGKAIDGPDTGVDNKEVVVDEELEQLKEMTRPDLNDMAKDLGIKSPESQQKFPNKTKLIEAILATDPE